ncbi:11811_t:CDS:2 [Rhizophagus irregularis]|nr:11811_t:CDS:2 [Rhizophagus irregularis]
MICQYRYANSAYCQYTIPLKACNIDVGFTNTDPALDTEDQSFTQLTCFTCGSSVKACPKRQQSRDPKSLTRQTLPKIPSRLI